MAGQASAAVLCGRTNVNPVQDVAAPFPTTTVIPLTGFSTPVANQRVDIKYNAECSIGGGPTNWLNTDIVIDPAGGPGAFVCPPSNNDNALCSGNHTFNHNDGWVSAVTNCVTILPTAGVHTVFVRVTPMPGVAWRVDDQSLKCEN
jgi:hypothetical protein